MTTKDETLDSACLLAVTGSTAYGLNHADSDIDKMGVFVAPTAEVAGLNWNKNKESWTNSSPEGDDLTLHEVGKFLKLTLGGNPTLIELLFMNDYEILDDVGQGMVDLREKIISEKTLRPAYYGYAVAQYRKVVATEDYKPKMARHTLRIARQGRALIETGSVNVKVENPTEYFELTRRKKEAMLAVIHEELDNLKNCKSGIRESPDKDAVADFLKQVRINNI